MAVPPRRPVRVLLLVVALASAGAVAACGDGVQGTDEGAAATGPSTTDPADAGGRDSTTTEAPRGSTTTQDPLPEVPAERVVPAPERPGDLGDDPELDTLADECFGGDLAACDRLFFNSDADSAYEAYGDSCGGRNEPEGLCVTLYGRG